MLATSTLIMEFALRANRLHQDMAHRPAYVVEEELEEEDDTNSLDTLAPPPTDEAPPPLGEETEPLFSLGLPAVAPDPPR